MFSILLQCPPGEEDLVAGELWEQDTAGVAEEPDGLRAFFESDERAPELLKRFQRLSPRLRMEAATDWEQVSRDAWPPMLVGDRFFLVPTWRDDAAPQGRLRLEIHPGMACGTGRHPATQLCLEAMERYVRPGATVGDVGSGSGILSAAACLLGAKRVIACDIDYEAVQIARQRVDVPFFTGSIDAVAADTADVIVANFNVSFFLNEIFSRACGPRALLADIPCGLITTRLATNVESITDGNNVVAVATVAELYSFVQTELFDHLSVCGSWSLPV